MKKNIDRRWLALIVLCLGDLMISLDMTVVNVALPSIKAALAFSETSLVWVVNAYLRNRDNPDPAEVEGGKTDLKRTYAWLETWLEANRFPPHVSLASCAAAPSLFYADWVERIPEGSRLAALRAELLALPAVSRCVEEARPYRSYFPPGAPDRD